MHFSFSYNSLQFQLRCQSSVLVEVTTMEKFTLILAIIVISLHISYAADADAASPAGDSAAATTLAPATDAAATTAPTPTETATVAPASAAIETLTTAAAAPPANENVTASASPPADGNTTVTTPTPTVNDTTTTNITTVIPATTTKVPLKVVCYYNKAAANRTGKAKYDFADVDSTLCTHVIYSYVSLDPISLTIQNESLGADAENLLALSKKNITVMLSLGGRDDPSESEKFSRMVKNGTARDNFLRNTVQFLKLHQFSGLDINWKYPVCWNGDCEKQSERVADKNGFANLLRELHPSFRIHNLTLSVAVSPLGFIADKAYDIQGIADTVDFINLMTFDYNRQTYNATAIHAPYEDVIGTANYWKAKGAPLQKLILGISTYGRVFTLSKSESNTPQSPASIGKATGLGEAGLAAYFEVCKGLNYQIKENEGSYAYKDDNWVSFDDLQSVTKKATYIKSSKLGGAVIWSLDTDDFNGVDCEQGKYPLVKAVIKAMES